MLLYLFKKTIKMWIVAILMFLGTKVSAQTCDESSLKALEQTRITTFAQVTQGSEGFFYIRYPLAGTTYTFIDQEGSSYEYTYTGHSLQNAIAVSVGTINRTRKFIFKAQNGQCTYTSKERYTITPQYTKELVVRTEPEWCGNSGTIYFQLIGVGISTDDYEFFVKKSSEPAYNFTVTNRIDPTLGKRALSAGSYDLIARLRNDVTKTIEKKNIKIENDIVPIQFTPQYVPDPCTGNGGVRVDVTSGKYPLYFTLKSEDGITVIRYKQTSNFFANVPKGNYQVLVEDFCAEEGGRAHTEPVSVYDYRFDTKLFRYIAAEESIACDQVTFSNLQIDVDNMGYFWTNKNMPLPFTLKVKFTSPSGQVYPIERTVNSYEEFERYFYSRGLPTLYWYETPQLPKEYGDWTISVLTTYCGTTKSLGALTRKIERSIDHFYVKTTPSTTCGRMELKADYTNMVNSNVNVAMPIYYVLEEYPATFNPNTAGFYMVTSSNTSISGKYVKRINTHSRANEPLLVEARLLNVGDTFRFKLVSEDCNEERLLDPITIPNSTTGASWVDIYPIASCKGTASNYQFATMYISGRNSAAYPEAASVKITHFDGDATKLPADVHLPYELPESKRETGTQKTWVLRDMPVGKYTFEYTDVCGNVASRVFTLEPEVYTIEWQEGCTPKIKWTLNSSERYWSPYFVEYFNKDTGSWEKLKTENGRFWLTVLYRRGTYETNVTSTKPGKYRIVRSIYTQGDSSVWGPYDCSVVISEKEYGGALQKPKAVGFACVGNKYHVAILAQGGTPPYTYTLVNKQVPGQAKQTLNTPSDDENFFLNVDAANLNTYYTFKVTDACGNADTVDGNISDFLPPTIAADREVYCSGQSATLSLPDLGSKIQIVWDRYDGTTTTTVHTGTTLHVASVTTGDVYTARLQTTYGGAVATCLSTAIAPYTIRPAEGAPMLTTISSTNQTLCTNGTNTDWFDLNTLFTDYNAIHPAVTKRIIDKAGVIAVPADGRVNIATSEFSDRENIFVYQLASQCGEVLQAAEAMLKVRRPLNFSNEVTEKNLYVCERRPTFNQLKESILEKGTAKLKANDIDFHWYTTYANAIADTHTKTGTDRVEAISKGNSKEVFLRLSANAYCKGAVMTITVTRLDTAALPNKDLGIVCAPSIGAIKKLIDATDFAKISIYQDGVPLVDAFELQGTQSLTYTKKVGGCETTPAKLTLTLQQPTAAQAQTIAVCADYNMNSNQVGITIGTAKAALRDIYTNATTITLYDDNGSEYTNDAVFIRITYPYLYFSVQEAGKCASVRYPLSFAPKDRTLSSGVIVSVCENSTIADIKAAIQSQLPTAQNLMIYKDTVLQTDTDTIEWWWATRYYYTIQTPGLCPSYKTQITLTKSGNTTPAPVRTVNLCGITNPKVSDVRAILGNNARVYVWLNNQWYTQPDTNFIQSNPAWAYYYTIEVAGKCVSERTPLSLNMTPAAPTATAQTHCVGATVFDLLPKEPSIRWYKVATGGTPLMEGERLSTGTYYAARYNGCESKRVAVAVTVNAPKVDEVIASPSNVPAGVPTNVNFIFKGTPETVATYNIDGGTAETVTLTAAGVATVTKSIAQTATLTVTRVHIGECSAVASVTTYVKTISSLAPITVIKHPLERVECDADLHSSDKVYFEAEAEIAAGFTQPIKFRLEFSKDNFVTTQNSGSWEATVIPPGQPNKRIAKKDTYVYAGLFGGDDMDGREYRLAFRAIVAGNEQIVYSNPALLRVYYIRIKTQPIAPATPYCKDAIATPLTVEAEGRGVTSMTYQWYENTENSTVGAQLIPGANETSYIPSTAQPGIKYYYVQASNNSGCDQPVSNIVKVEVLSPTTITLQPQSASYCKNEVATALSLETDGTGTPTYHWYANTADSYVGATQVGTSATYVPSTTVVGTKYYFATVSRTCGTITSTIAAITVHPDVALTGQSTSLTLCYHEPTATISVTATGRDLHYQWFDNGSTNSNTGGTLLAGETDNIFFPPTDTAGVKYYYAEVMGACGAMQTTHPIRVEVQRAATPTVTSNVTLCPTAVNAIVSFVSYVTTPTTGYTLRWYETAVAPTAIATPTVNLRVVTSTTITRYVTQVNAFGCESERIPITIKIEDTIAPTVTVSPTLAVACNATNRDTLINQWLSQAAATDICGAIATFTHNYNQVKPSDFCESEGIVTVTYTAKDTFGNTTTKTSTLVIVAIKATTDSFTITHGSATTTTAQTVLTNDKVGNRTATTSTVSLTTEVPAVGETNSATPTLNADGTITVPSGTKSGTYTIVYKICTTLSGVTACATTTAIIKVGSTPLIANPDTDFNVPTGSVSSTSTKTVIENDRIGNRTPTTTDVTITTVSTTTDVEGNTNTPTIDPSTGKVKVPAGTRSGTYTITYSICERLNPDNCKTSTVTVKVGSTPLIANPDTDFNVPTGSVSSTSTKTVIENDRIGNRTPTTTDVTITTVSTTTDVEGNTNTPTIDPSTGKVKVPAGTRSGTYTITYSICERLNPDNCKTSTVTVKVGGDTATSTATPTIETTPDELTYTGTTITSPKVIGNVLTNDKVNGRTPTTASVTISTPSLVPNRPYIRDNGEVVVPPSTPNGTYTTTYTLCTNFAPVVCSTTPTIVTITVSITVTGTTTPTTDKPIAVDDNVETPVDTPIVVDVLRNDTPKGATTPNIVTLPQHGTIILGADGTIEYRPDTNYEGIDRWVYEICNMYGCASATVTVNVMSELIPYNGMSVDGDGKNEHFHIAGITRYSNNTVRVFNRWGIKVFEIDGYNNTTNVFLGRSQARATFEPSDMLPQGTYYYVIEYYDEHNQRKTLTGWLYLKR